MFFFQAEDGIRDLVRSRGLGDVYKRQELHRTGAAQRHLAHRCGRLRHAHLALGGIPGRGAGQAADHPAACLLYTSDAADERSSVDLGGRRIIKKKKNNAVCSMLTYRQVQHLSTTLDL